MKKSLYVILLIISVVMMACKQKNPATKYENPNWVLTENNNYSVSMTAAVRLPDNMNLYLTEDDQMVALVGNEVRGVGRLYQGIFYIHIMGTDDEKVNVSFQYWSAKTQYKYQADEIFPFKQDAILGTPDEPLVFTFKVL